ncbi:MAG: hypothetical protein AAFY05_22465 [Pseudomonadota bacterium]
MTRKVIILDAAKIDIIVNQTGVAGLNAIVRRGDLFMFGDDARTELENGAWYQNPKNADLLETWLKQQEKAGRIVKPKRLVREDRKKYDPNNRRLTEKGGHELWDMSARKFMAENPHFEFEVISSDKAFFQNEIRRKRDPATGMRRKIVDTPFTYTSLKKLMGELIVDPDLNLSKEQFVNIAEYWHGDKYGSWQGMKQGSLYFPPTYEDAMRQRAFRSSKARGENFGLSSQADARLGVAPVDQGSAVPLLPSDAPLEGRLDGLTGSQTGGEIGGRIDPEAGLSGKASGSLQEGPSIGRRFMNMLRKGAPVVLLGLAIPPVFSAVKARAEERNVPFDQAARELGLEFGEEELKDLAAEAGIDLAITFTPIGPLKKAWDVLGNIDDIVSLMQLYGDAYPENETIQQMAALADELEGSAALAAYVDGRDALTGVVGGAIDFVFGNAASEEEAAEAIGKVRSAIREGSEELGEAAAKGAGREELTDLLIRRARASEPAPLAEPDFSAPDMSSGPLLEGEARLSGTGQIPGSDPILPSTLEAGAPGDEGPSEEAEGPAQGSGFNGEAPAGAEFIRKTGVSFSPAAGDPAQAATGVDPYARKTSYDQDRKLGRTPEEEEEALAEFEDLLREAYVVTGDMLMARGMASAQLKVEWGSSAFAAEEGTVMKYPVEKAYADPEEDGHGYVRTDVESLLASAGIKARRWYLEPNGKTAEDRFRGSMDKDGYGPRMTLSYDDEAGTRHVVTEGFQAHVAGARQRRQAAEDRKLQELAREYGLEPPEPPEVNPFQALRDGLAREARFPELRLKAQEKRDRSAQTANEPAVTDMRKTPEAPIRPLPDDPPLQGGNQSTQYQQGGANRPFSLPERN